MTDDTAEITGRDRPLEGQVCLIVGAGEGIGRACAQAFAEAGAVVALVARDEGRLSTLEEALEVARETATEDGVSEVAVIGGAAIFAAALPRAKRIQNLTLPIGSSCSNETDARKISRPLPQSDIGDGIVEPIIKGCHPQPAIARFIGEARLDALDPFWLQRFVCGGRVRTHTKWTIKFVERR